MSDYYQTMRRDADDTNDPCFIGECPRCDAPLDEKSPSFAGRVDTYIITEDWQFTEDDRESSA